MRAEYGTGLALSVKPLPHGKMKFRIYAEYKDIRLYGNSSYKQLAR